MTMPFLNKLSDTGSVGFKETHDLVILAIAMSLNVYTFKTAPLAVCVTCAESFPAIRLSSYTPQTVRASKMRVQMKRETVWITYLNICNNAIKIDNHVRFGMVPHHRQFCKIK